MKNITIYTKKICPFCVRAKELLDQKGAIYQEISIDNDAVKRQEMIDKSGRHTVPQIFIDDTAIGGCDAILSLDHQGKLDTMLQSN